MSLPVIDLPKYSTQLPSTGQDVLFRPFLVREQKQLLIAVNGDAEQQIQAMMDTIDACTFGKLDVSQLPAYDLEYLFLQIRAKSIGETIGISLTCNHCAHVQDGKIDITEVQVDKPEGHANIIELDGNLTVEMSDPDLRQLDELRRDFSADAAIVVIAGCIRSIWEGDELYAAQDYSVAELVSWIENLSPANFTRIEEFFNTLPVLKHSIDFTCNKCGGSNTAVLEGLQNFFV